MSRLANALKLSSTLVASFIMWNADRIVCAANNVAGKNGSGRQRHVTALESSDELEITRAMQMRHPCILRDDACSHESLSGFKPEELAEEVEPMNVCVTPMGGTFSYDSEINVRMLAREFVERVFEGRPTSSMLYLRIKDCNILKRKVKDRIGPYQVYPNSSTVFISQAGCVTRLHHDAAHGFLTQIRGAKKVILFAPEQAFNLYENPISFVRRNQFSNLPETDCMQADIGKFSRLSRTDRFEVVLEPGNTLYIPPFWWHQVTSLDPSVSFVVAYQLRKHEYNLARSFTNNLQKFAHRAGIVRQPMPQQYISSEFEASCTSSGARRMDGTVTGQVGDAIYDLDPQQEQSA